MMLIMTEVIKLDSDRVKKKRKEVFGSQRKMIDAWVARFGDSPHQTHISKVEQGVKSLSLERIGQLAELLETNIDFLINRSDDDKPASDLDDQVVFPVRTEAERKLLNEIGTEFMRLSAVDQGLVLELVRKLPRGPRIIGGE